MGADFRWMMCAVDAADGDVLAAEFPFENVDDVLDEDRRLARTRFREAPASLLPRRVALGDDVRIVAEHARAFSSLFALPGFAALPRRLGIGGENMLTFLSGETSPVEVLFYALGAEQAERLPGCFGNVLVRAKDLRGTLASVEQTLARLDEASWDRARRIVSICSGGEPAREHDAQIEQAFAALPDGMRRALERGKDFVATAFWLG